MKRALLSDIEPHILRSNPCPHVLRARPVEAWICDSGYLVTEVLSDELFVWCYEGRRFVPELRRLAAVAIRHNLRTIGWFTRHVAPLRLFRDVRGFVEFAGDGEVRYRLNCEDICARLRKTLIERPPFARLAVTRLPPAVTRKVS